MGNYRQTSPHVAFEPDRSAMENHRPKSRQWEGWRWGGLLLCKKKDRANDSKTKQMAVFHLLKAKEKENNGEQKPGLLESSV